MSAADTRRDTGDFYPGGKRVVTTPVTMGGDVKHSDFADVTVETNTMPKMRLALETLAQKLGATVAAVIAAVFVANGAGFDSVPVNDIDFDANPSVVTNVTFDGLLQAETDPSWAARSNAVMQAVWSLGSLACLDALGWSDITNKPSWIGATKPTYSLNEICPDSENWLGVQGNAGRHIKVLAGTRGGQIVGGLRVTASTQNDNNMTTYTYGGVAVRRNGTNTDYVFDTSSQSGIVRRSELASLAPGDYANVSNRAVHALGNTGDQTLSDGCFTIDHIGPDGDSWLQTKRGLQIGLGLTLDGFKLHGNYYALPLSPGRLALESQIPSGDEWSATNTVAVIARHAGKETVSIPSGGNLVADLSGWNDGVQTFVVLQPSGAYTVASNVEYCGYGTWPTNTALCVAWPYAGTLYVNPITIIRE